MHCFNHGEKQAIAACKSCGRAVCNDCATDLGFAVTCSERCATDAAELQEMNQRAKRIYGLAGAKPVIPLAVLMWGLMGVMFCSFGAYASVTKGRPEWFLIVFGVLCLVLGVISYRRVRAMQLNC